MPLSKEFMGGYDFARRRGFRGNADLVTLTPKTELRTIEAATSGFECDLGIVAAQQYVAYTKDQRAQIIQERQDHTDKYISEDIRTVEDLERSWTYLDGLVEEYCPEAHEASGLNIL